MRRQEGTCATTSGTVALTFFGLGTITREDRGVGTFTLFRLKRGFYSLALCLVGGTRGAIFTIAGQGESTRDF